MTTLENPPATTARAEVTPQQRGEHEVRVAAVEARDTDVALEVTSTVFEGLGARATAA